LVPSRSGRSPRGPSEIFGIGSETSASCWIEAGLTPKTVQTFAGHSSLQVTMDRYGHLFKSDDHKRAMEAIAAEMLG
jgi:integrase